MTTADKIKARWPLPSMLARCGISIPPRGKFPSPFRPDRNPSCEVYGDTIRDRSTGERFDVVAIFADANKLTNDEAFRRLAEELPNYAPKVSPKVHKLQVPSLGYSKDDAHLLASSRGLTPYSTEFAGAFFGTLGFANVAGFHCWILTDGESRIAEARRMDGKPFPAVGFLGERKSHTLRGSCKSWPIGMKPPKIKRVPQSVPVVLVEGGPDYLAALDMLAIVQRDFLPVALMGAGQFIHADALSFFKRRDVLILAHPDDAGRQAAQRWAAQLKTAGARPRAVQLEGGDLCYLVARDGVAVVAGGLGL